MKTFKLSACLILFLMGTVISVQAEDLNTIFKNVNKYVAAKNYPKAIEELKWAEKELNKLNTQALKTLFPKELEGFKGGEAKVTSVLGMTNLEVQYQQKDKKFELNYSGASGSKAGPFGGLGGALGQMAALAGNQPGVDSFRIDGRTANAQSKNGRQEVMVYMNSGGIMKFESRSVEIAKLKEIAKKFPFEKIDKYAKGEA